MPPDHDPQTLMQKILTVAAGVGGISLKWLAVVSFAQQVGIVVGCVLVCGQAYVFFRDQLRKWRSSK